MDGLSPVISNNDSLNGPDYWKDRIQESMPKLYPIYSRAIDCVPCEKHYNRLREAAECVQSRLEGRPLPSSFKAWKFLDHDTNASVIIDQKGREIFHFQGEARNTLIVRLALRGEQTPYIPVSPDPLAHAFEVTPDLFRNNIDHFHGGLLTGCTHNGRPIYLFGEYHNIELYRQTKRQLGQLAAQGKIAFFSEGYPRITEMELELKTLANVPASSYVLGLENAGYYCLVSCIEGVAKKEKNALEILKCIYWHLKWTDEGREIWKTCADKFEKNGSLLLQTAFAGVHFHDSLSSDVCRELAFLDTRQFLGEIGNLVMDRYPEVNLTDKEKGRLSDFFKSPELDESLYDKCYRIVQGKRDQSFAHNLSSYLSNLPEGLPAVADVGMAHLHGFLEQLRAQLADGPLKDPVNSIKKRVMFAKELHKSVTRSFWDEIMTVMHRVSLKSRLAETRSENVSYRRLKKICLLVVRLNICRQRIATLGWNILGALRLR